MIFADEPPPPYSLQNYDYEDSHEHSTSSIYPSLNLSSPRRRVSSSLDHSQGSPLSMDPAQAALPAATPGTSIQETSPTPYPSSCQTPLELGLEAVPPTVLPLSFDAPRSSAPPPRPQVSPAQAAASPPQPPTACAILKTSKTVLASADLSSASTTLPETLQSPKASHQPPQLQCDLPPHKISNDYDEQFIRKQEYPQDQIYLPLSFTGSLPHALSADKHVGKNTGVNQNLEIVDFNPDWDNNYEDDLSMAVGGANIGEEKGSL